MSWARRVFWSPGAGFGRGRGPGNKVSGLWCSFPWATWPHGSTSSPGREKEAEFRPNGFAPPLFPTRGRRVRAVCSGKG